jgi:outer membrane murein-binding lipoprotein Lpp
MTIETVNGPPRRFVSMFLSEVPMLLTNLLKTTAVIAVMLLVLAGCASEEKKLPQTHAQTDDLPSLQAKLDERKAASEKRASEEVKKAFSEGVDSVALSGVMETALNVGDTAPDFTLPNATGEYVQLSTLLHKGPVILSWYRGGW